MPALTRGPLPARVYWVRRTMVLGTAALLVVAIARLLGGGSDASSGSDPAAQTSRKPGKKATRKQEPELAQPQGPCANQDVAITPIVTEAVGGEDVPIVLQLRTITADACVWRVSPDTVTVNITSGKDDIWTSRHCPRAIAPQDVVVRKAVTTEVSLVWGQAKRSDSEGCTKLTGWASPGWYHVTAAALGGEPSDVQFELTAPVAGTITKTVKPKNTPSSSPSGRPVTPGQSTKTPGKSPSGAVEPNG